MLSEIMFRDGIYRPMGGLTKSLGTIKNALYQPGVPGSSDARMRFNTSTEESHSTSWEFLAKDATNFYTNLGVNSPCDLNGKWVEIYSDKAMHAIGIRADRNLSSRFA